MMHNPETCAACGKHFGKRGKINDECPFCRSRVCAACCHLAREVVWALHRLELAGGSGNMTAMRELIGTPGVPHDSRWPDKEALNECAKLGLMTKRSCSRDGGFFVWTITDAGRKFLQENPL